MGPETRDCQNCKNPFVIEPEDFAFYGKLKVPSPTWCPECRLVRRLLWRCERALYKRPCNVPGHTEELISYIASDKQYPVYCQKFWWSDEWDARDFGQAYDFSKPFFAQLKELFDRVPKSALSTNYTTMVNSEYSNWAGDCKNCYLVTDADYVEDCAHCSTIFKSNNCYDSDFISNSELCYDSFNLVNCYRTIASVNCRDSSDIWFSKNCNSCTNCFGCVNLRSKSYCIFNKQYTKEEYGEEVKKLFDGTYSGYEKNRKKSHDFWEQSPERSMQGFSNVNSDGNFVYNSKNTTQGFFVADAEDSKFVSLIHSPNVKDCYDYTDWGENARNLYECCAVGAGADNIKFCNLTVLNSRNAEYSYFSHGSNDIFGCASLHKEQYCILNKQYSKEEYEDLLPKIKKHMDEMPYIDAQGKEYKYGEFFPPELCHFAYNETAAQEFFPLTKDIAQAKGYRWRDDAEKKYIVTMQSDGIPSSIQDVADDVLKEVIACEHKGSCNDGCTTAFRFIPTELNFYRRFQIPPPHLCPNCRRKRRSEDRPPMQLRHRQCSCNRAHGPYVNTASHVHGAEPCPNEFDTSYASDRTKIVYCESCYQAEVA